MKLRYWMVLGVLVFLGLAGAAFFLGNYLWASRFAKHDSAITVQAVYPGANAQVVADTVAAPIEQQVNGVENMVSMRSQCGNDGTYQLWITFEKGTDLNVAQVLVQNRVSLAKPVLPDAVNRLGVSVRKKSPQVVLFVLLFSTDDRYDTTYLSNYALVQIKDELVRLQGVADVELIGKQPYSVRVCLDPDKLGAHGLTATEVADLLRKQKGEIARQGEIITFHSRANLLAADEVGECVLETDGRGRIVRLRDVARIELQQGSAQGSTRFDGKPVVALAVYPLSQTRLRDVSAAVRDKMTALRADFPEGLESTLAFDFAANRETPRKSNNPGYLRVDLVLPDETSKSAKMVERCDRLIRETPGVEHVLALGGPPFAESPRHACLLVSLDQANSDRANREAAMTAIRDSLAREAPEGEARLCDLTVGGRFPLDSYPVALGLYAPMVEGDPTVLAKYADRLAARLKESGKITDLAIQPGKPVPRIYLDIDREKAKAEEVSLNDLMATLQVGMGSAYVNDLAGFGRSWQLRIAPSGPSAWSIEDLKQLKIRNRAGKMIPLNRFVKIQRVEGPWSVERYDLSPLVTVSGNPAPGVSEVEARRVGRALAEEVRQELKLSVSYRYVELPRE